MINSSDAATTHRIEQLESRVMELITMEHRARKWKTIAVVSSLAATVLVGVAATQSARTPDVIRARRFEVVDQNEKIVLLAGIGQAGGQIDVWSNTGANVMRFGSNRDGGDLAIWNNASQGVASIYATEAGSSVEVRMKDGSGSASLRADATAPSMVIADSTDRPRVVASLGGDATGVTISNPDGKIIAAVGDTNGSGGIMSVSQEDGMIAARMMALPDGGSIGCANRGGSRAAVLESGSAQSGGSLALFGPDGGEAITATARTESGARFMLYGSKHQPLAIMEGGTNDSAIIAFLQGGLRVAGLGSSATGGLLNLSKSDGTAVLVAGSASDADGGAISVRSGAGSQLVRIGVDRVGAGEVAVYDGTGLRKRVLSAILPER